jgi:hypothetical protein
LLAESLLILLRKTVQEPGTNALPLQELAERTSVGPVEQRIQLHVAANGRREILPVSLPKRANQRRSILMPYLAVLIASATIKAFPSSHI